MPLVMGRDTNIQCVTFLLRLKMQTYTGKPQSVLCIYLLRDPGAMGQCHMPMQTLGAGLTGAPRGSLGLDTGAELGRRATAGENWGQDQTLHKLPGHPGIWLHPRVYGPAGAKTQRGSAGLTSSPVTAYSLVFSEGMQPGPHAYQPPELSVKPSVLDGVLQRNRTNRMCIYRRRFILRNWPSRCGHCMCAESL